MNNGRMRPDPLGSSLRVLLPVLLAALVLACSAPRSAEAPPDRPNILLILLDDLGYDDLGVNGNQIVETPHIDRLARESVQFESFYVTPVCAPTRAALLTGRHHLRTGVSHVHGGKDFVDLGETMLPELLREAGYATGMWGKWHSGTTDGYLPWQRGFDEAFMAQLYVYFDNAGVTNGEPDPQKGWTPARLTDKAIDFIGRHRDEPFFAYLPYLTVHAPLDAPESLVEKYRAKGLEGSLAVLYGMVDGVDSQVKRLLDVLEALEIDERTVVFFLSDNGPWVGTHTLTEEEHRIRYVSGMRGHKGDIWENGVRSPLFVRWPGRLEPHLVRRPADVTDLLPTILALAGVEAKTSRPLDGRSLVPALEGKEETAEPRRIYRYAHPGWISGERPWTPEGLPGEYAPVDKSSLVFERQALALRDGRHKLLLNPLAADHEGEPGEPHLVLVDLEDDPREQANRAADEPARAAALLAELRRWWDEILAEPSAFEAPVFVVGLGERDTAAIKAAGPGAVDGAVTNSFNALAGWQAGGQAAFRLDVRTPGEYEVTAEFLGRGPREAVFVVGAAGAEGRLEIGPEGQQIPARIRLSTGPVILNLALERASPADALASSRMSALVLRRR